MTCGLCDPAVFRSTEKGRVYGYAVAKTPQEAINASRSLFFMGCQQVFCDRPTGRVLYRPYWVLLCKVVREGDKVVLPSFSVLGDRPSRQEPYLDHLDSLGVEVFALTQAGSKMAAINELFDKTTQEDAAA